MPILHENRSRYPANWPSIRRRILDRAKHACEGCGIPNHIHGYRDAYSIFHRVFEHDARNDGRKIIKIVLTIAHLNHTPEDCSDENLRAFCQQCHNRHDMPHRVETRARRRRMAFQGTCPDCGKRCRNFHAKIACKKRATNGNLARHAT